jgi:hypothetical protein
MYVIVNVYPRSDAASSIQEDMWDRHVPRMKEISGFVSVAYLATDAGSEGASRSYRDAAQAYLDSSIREETDAEGLAFDRRRTAG